MRPRPNDDDEPTGLPASDGDAEGQRTLADEGAEIELDVGDDEDVGLDAEAGIDEPIDADLVFDADENASLLAGSEAAEDLVDGDDEIDASGGEYGWTDESEPSTEDVDDGAIEFDETEASSDDFGEEGFGDDDGSTDFEGFRLPPLAHDPELDLEDDEHAHGRGETESTGVAAHSSAERVELAPGVHAVRLPEARVRCDLLLRSGRPLHALLAVGATGVAWDGSLLVAEPDDARPSRRFSSAEQMRALAATKTPSGVEIVLAAHDGLMRSGDWGHVFDRMTAWPHAEGPSSLALCRRLDGGIRLLAAAPEGALLASDDGRSFFPLEGEDAVLRLAADHSASAVMLRRGAGNQPIVRLSLDAGSSFEDLAAPVGEPERVQDVQVAGAAVLLCRRAPEPRILFSGPLFADDEWHELLMHASPPMRILTERRGAMAYACLLTPERLVLVRRAIEPGHGERAGLELVTELPRDLGAALQLAGGHVDGITTLQVGTERGWMRVTILPEGGDA